MAKLDDTFNVHCSYTWETSEYTNKFLLTWRELFGIVSPYLLQPLHVDSVRYNLAKNVLEKQGITKIYNIQISDKSFNIITIQLKALGLINVESLKTVKGGMELFWSLTKKGEELMMNIVVVKSKKLPSFNSSKKTIKSGTER